ncbi:MAG: orotate phosphoribosyltransferase [Armatimonadetes bacterium]|nr:orotate phosphoribosyltransferase [Armatimonadota bacterium]
MGTIEDFQAEKEELRELIATRALRFGDFVLASGQRSTYYIDGKQITLHSRGLYLLARLLMKLIEDWPVEAVGGMSIGADPIAGAIAALAGAEGRPLDAFIVRKEAKERGTRKQVEGPLSEGARVVVLEDVITTGGSSLQAIEALRREVNAEVLGVAAMVDRLQGGRENLGAHGVELRSLFTIRDFGIEPPPLRAPVAE